MNTKTQLVALLAVLAVFMFSFASAAIVDESNVVVNFNGVDINGVGVDATSVNLTMSGDAGDTVPVKVSFIGIADASDVKVRVEIYGGSEDFFQSTSRFNVVSGSVYTKLLNLQLPSDLRDTTKDLVLKVRIYNQDNEYSAEFPIVMQRDSYKLDVISLDFDSSVSAGDSVPVAVVIKNIGFENSQDGFVTITIPELGVYAKGYFGDLVAVDNCTSGSECDVQDATQKVLYLKIPETAKDGVYSLIAKVYDSDSVSTVTESISVSASTATQVIPATKSQDMKAGETKTFTMILVNSGSKIMVYNLQAVSGSDLTVSVPSVVTVDAGSSKEVQVTVTASSDAEAGVYPFTVSANGVSTTFNANVTGKTVSLSAVALTVVLVIVFIVLLVVLIVLLTKKDKPTTEVETSYY